MPELIKKEAENLSEMNDGPYIPPQVEDVGEAFVKWAEEYWGLESAYKLVDESKGPNTESAPWNYIRNIFVGKINELIKYKKPTKYPPGYYSGGIKEG